MSQYRIEEVTSSSQLRQFLRLPDRLYRDCPQYVPNIRIDEKSIFTKSPCLDYCQLKMWLVYCGKKVVGRVAGIINPRENEIYNVSRARFGWIEFEKDIEIARLLIGAVERWAGGEGMEEIHGPLGYNTWYKQGMLTYGFDNMPPTNCIYNFDYYPAFMSELGFEKEADWIQYKITIPSDVPEKLSRIKEVLLKRYPLKVVDIRELRKHDDVAEKFFHNYNETFKRVHNFIPLTDKEVKVLGKKYIKMLRPELNCFVMDDKNRIAAYGICIPSLSQAFHKTGGKLFPFGWIQILRAYRHYDVIDLMMVGADPQWQSKGVSAIYHDHLTRQFSERGIKSAITNPQIETNNAVKVWDDYKDKELYMRRRCYIKTINK